MSKPLVKELAWLLLAVAITLVLAFTVFDWGSFSREQITIKYYDIYSDVSIEIFLVALFSIICFLMLR